MKRHVPVVVLQLINADVFQSAPPVHRTFSYHLNTVWLVTVGDIKCIVFPVTAFGIFSALSGAVHDGESLQYAAVLSRLPHVVVWIWLNLLVFDLANQRLPQSILEDSINKPWRALPSRRITSHEARQLLLAVLPLVLLVVYNWFGGVDETVTMMILTWMYNDLGGADENMLVRNGINALGYMCYISGATKIALKAHELNSTGYQWIGIVGLVVLTTLQTQDMADQEGDLARGRRTAPLVLGDGAARWTVAIPVVAWSVLCPAFWAWRGAATYGLVYPFGTLLAARVLVLRDVEADQMTWKLWCFWMFLLSSLPLFSL